MSFNELLDAVKDLSPEEIIRLRGEIEKIESSFVNHGVSEQQWESVKQTQKLLNEGKMKTFPAREALAEMLNQYK